MGSPGQIPNYRGGHHRSIVGAIVLIAIGVLFLLQNMGILEWRDLGYWFAHYWPLLLILWGIIHLLEYYDARRRGSHAYGIGAGGIFLLFLIVLFGLAATRASRWNWPAIGEHFNNPDFPFYWGHSYAYQDQLTQAFPAGASLHIVDDHGGVNVTVSQDNSVHVTVRKRVNADRQSDADKWNDETKPQFTLTGQTLNLNANTQGAGRHFVAADLDVAVPRKAALVISNGHGDVNVQDREGDTTVTNQHGEVDLTNIQGNVQLNLDHSSARLAQIAANVQIEGRADDVSLEDVKGMVQLNGDFMESLRLSNIAKSVTFKSPRTTLDFAKITGDVNLDSGDLRASGISGPVRIDTRSKDIQLEDVSGDVHVDNENGLVEIHMIKAASMQVNNRQGDIQVYLPEKAAFQLNAKTAGGEVQSDFDSIAISNRGDGGTGSGTVKGGGPHLVLNNEHGSIEIHRGTAVAEAPSHSGSMPGDSDDSEGPSNN